MPRPKKDYQTLNIKLEKSINERFEAYCEDMGQTKTTAIERILCKHLDEYDKMCMSREQQGWNMGLKRDGIHLER